MRFLEDLCFFSQWRESGGGQSSLCPVVFSDEYKKVSWWGSHGLCGGFGPRDPLSGTLCTVTLLLFSGAEKSPWSLSE